MKQLHRDNFWCWSEFNAERNIDFNSWLWVRPEGNVVIDPLPLSAHDATQLDQLGGVAWVIVTNSDHVRATSAFIERGAKVAGPAEELETMSAALGRACDRWLNDGDEIASAEVVVLNGSKTPGELALVLEGDTLVTGDLIRGQRGGALNLLPAAKLKDVKAARESLSRLANRPSIGAVLVGDGWPIFRGGHARLTELLHPGELRPA
jgi:hypothetical protein